MTELTTEKKLAIIEAAIMISGHSLSINNMVQLFEEHEDEINKSEIKELLDQLEEKYADSGIQLKEVASGYRFQARPELSPWLAKLWSERPPRYSRALLETLAIIAYKQPVTRAEIEEIRGVTVSTHIVKTLLEREWIKVVGFRELPGKPAIYGTTKAFLDYFNLKSLTELPTLAEFKDIETQDQDVQVQLALEQSDIGPSDSANIPEENIAEIHDEEAQTTNNHDDLGETLDPSQEASDNIVELHPENNLADTDEGEEALEEAPEEAPEEADSNQA